ncbi:MAG: SWIB/MDM2 domain-containing protein [Gemmatimonadales bacterium]
MATRKKAAKRSAKKSAKRPSAKRSTKKAAKRSGKKRTPSAAFMRPVTPDSALSAVVGSSPLPRTELTKKLWAYIKRNGLQDSKNRRAINADDKLRPVFNGKSQVSMFDMTKMVSRHVS